MFRLLLLLVIALAVTGWALDWFTFEKGTNEEGKTKFEIVVDDEKIDEDTAKAKEAVGDTAGKAVDKGAEFVADGKVEGTVVSVDRDAGRLAVRGDDDAVVELRIDGDLKVRKDGAEASLDDVAAGATVRVLYDEEGGVKRATRVVILG